MKITDILTTEELKTIKAARKILTKLTKKHERLAQAYNQTILKKLSKDKLDAAQKKRDEFCDTLWENGIDFDFGGSDNAYIALD